MKISLKEFENHIDDIIVERGLEYWECELVSYLTKVGDGVWESEVMGTDDYFVQIQVKDGDIIYYDCTCPYDWGPVCKHVVAVLFAIRQKLKEGTASKKVRKSGKKEKKLSKTPLEQISDILEKIPQNLLSDFVRNYAERNRDFRNMFIMEFLDRTHVRSKNEYRQIIVNSYKAAMDRHGIIGYWDTGKAVRNIRSLLQKAEDDFKQDNFKKVIPVCQAVIEESVPAIQCSDDSNGEIGEVIEWAFRLFEEMPPEQLDEKLSKDFFDYCLQEAIDEKYRGWDWCWDLLRIAVDYVQDDLQENQLLNQIEKLSIHENSRFDLETAAQIKLDLFRKRKTDKEVREYIESNLNLPSFRRQSIEEAFRKKQYSTARQLAEEGVKIDTENKLPGSVAQWTDWLLKISEKEKKVKDIRKYARQLFFSIWQMEYYHKLKSTYDKKKWVKELNELIGELKEKGMTGTDTLANIYIEEKRWDDLFHQVKSHADFSTLTNYEKYLKDAYFDELIHMYETAVRKFLADFTGRPAYQQCCRILRRMRKLGAEQQVENLISELRNQYKKRPALQDELSRV